MMSILLDKWGKMNQVIGSENLLLLFKIKNRHWKSSEERNKNVIV